MAVIKDKILVIEDEKSINYLIGTVLTANGYDQGLYRNRGVSDA